MEFTADFVQVYGVFMRGLLNRRPSPIIPSFSQTLNHQVWSDSLGSEQQRKQMVPFRAAAAVAVKGYEPDKLRFDFAIADQQLPAHISAILNPLEQFDMVQLHNIISAGSVKEPQPLTPSFTDI